MTGRFSQRPHYDPKELDQECEMLIVDFLKSQNGAATFPVSTDDLTRLVERDSDDLDLYADLSAFGPAVEGMTEFRRGSKPRVSISAELANDDRRKNRLRTTLTHEYGHVHFHAYLWDVEPPGPDLLGRNPHADKQICKRDDIYNAARTDWMEWQAGYVCGAVLMPVGFVRRLIKPYLDANDLYGIVGTNDSYGQELIRLVQEGFAVSSDAARVRLTKLDILGPVGAGPSLFSTIKK